MQEFPPPTVVVSRCLGFESCKYDGQILQNELVNRLQEYVNIIPVCPEMEIGLGVPRQALRLVDDTRIRLIQPATDRDFTGDMETFSRQFLKNLDRVDGFILQNRSPSCGVDDCKLYLPGRDSPVGKTSGFFSEELSGKEKQFFLDTLDKYRREKVLASVPLNILKSWIIKYDNEYLKRQAYFNPFPGNLVDLEDSGRGLRPENT